MRRLICTIIAGMVGCLGLLCGSSGEAAEVVPFYLRNQSPLVQGFGIPAPERATLLPPGGKELTLIADMASIYAVDNRGGERIVLDGESYHYTLAFRYGTVPGREVGIDIPYVVQSAGFLDSFVEGWHDTFGLPQGGRDTASRNRLLYRYQRDGDTRLLVDQAGSGLGDIMLFGAGQLYLSEGDEPAAAAFRVSVKLPTGAGHKLRGSGSTDIALQLAASESARTDYGPVTVYATAGGMFMTKGSVLREQQRNLAGFGTLGVGWSPLSWLAVKVQGNANTAFFRKSELRELSSSSVQLLIGGTLAFTDNISLDLGVSEDVVVNTSPDVAFHFALRSRF